MSSSITALIPELQQPAHQLLDIAGSAGVLPRVTSTLRTHSEQSHLYKRFLAGLSAFPVAPPGTSAHEYGYAFDLVVNSEEAQMDLGTVWTSWGGKWSPNDRIHFEYPGFVAPPPEETSFLRETGIVAASLALPGAVSVAPTLAEFVTTHPQAASAVDFLLGQGFPLAALWNLELSALYSILPQWALDILGI